MRLAGLVQINVKATKINMYTIYFNNLSDYGNSTHS